MRTDFFLHHGAWVQYLVFGNTERGYSAKADVSFLQAFPVEYIPIRLEKIYCNKAEAAIIDFCKRFIEENKITLIEED